jgi:cobalt/nickel transport system permease protein
MASIDNSLFNIGYLETLSYQSTPIHRLDPRVKILTTMVFIVVVVSFPKYAVGNLVPFIIYPVALIALGNVPLGYLGKKILIAAPFAFFIGIFNPLLDRTVMVHLGPLAISGGWVSFTSIMLRFVLTVSAALVLVAVTGFFQICFALERLGLPRVFALQLLFLYRYLFVLGSEAARMVRARSLRSFDGRGQGFRAYTSLLGHLLLRTLDRAQRLHLAMLSRGFDGEIRLLHGLRLRGRDLAFFLGWSGVFVLLRLVNISQLWGTWVMELLK